MHGKRLRVGLAPGLRQLDPGTGHGKVWSSVLAELHKIGRVTLVERGRADVWLASAHEPPPDGRPLVVQAHEAAWREPELRAILHPEFAAALDTVTGATLAQAAAVIAPSNASRAQISDAYSFPLERVHTVHHGVDHQLFRPGLDGGRELAGGPYVLFVGVLHPRKNFEAVRQAVADLAARGLPHKLVIVGGLAPLPDAPEFERAAQAELPEHPDRLRSLRGIPPRDLAALMGGADVFCLPSVFEGFGLPALEAMACGAPVIVSDRGALPEVVGDAGIICSPDAAAVSAEVARVIAEPELAERMRRAAIERAAEFSWARTAAGWLAVLRDCA